jgi:hypothetical protein
MSWHFSQALVAEYSEATCLDGEQCVPSKSSSTADESSSSAKMMECYRRSLSGMMSPPSMARRGAVLSMSSVAGFPARTFPPPGAVPELKGHVLAYGHTWQELSVKYALDSSSWRTHRCLFDEDLPWSSVTLPSWGMMLAGVCWELTMSERRTSASVSGSWPTPKASPSGPDFARIGRPRSGGDDLATAVARRRPTPTANKVTQSGEIVNSDGTPWDGVRKPHSKTTGKPITTALADAVVYPTPTTEANQMCPSMMDRGVACRNLRAALGGPQAGNGGQLNPTWVEWLMGWPLGWTDLKQSATGRFQAWQRQHGDCSEGHLWERRSEAHNDR